MFIEFLYDNDHDDDDGVGVVSNQQVGGGERRRSRSEARSRNMGSSQRQGKHMTGCPPRSKWVGETDSRQTYISSRLNI